MKWQSASFGDVFDIQLGKMLDEKKNVGDLRPYLANRNVQWGECEVSNLREMRFTEADREKFRLRRGDLLVCEGGEAGRTAVWRGELEECYYQKAIHRLRPTTDVEPRFVLHFMRWAAGRRMFARLTSSTSIAHLTKAKLQKLPLPLPPPEEQKRIAGILDTADGLRAKRREALAQLDTILQSTFLDMFGDPVTNPMGWQRRLVGDLAVKVTKGTTPTTLGMPFVPAGIPFVRVQNLVDRRVDTSRDPLFINDQTHKKLARSQIRRGDILISIAGTIGRTALVDTDFALNCNQAVAIVRLGQEVDRSFLLHWLGTADAIGRMKGRGVTGTITNLSLGQIKVLQALAPPLDLQRRFAAVVEAIERQKSHSRAHLTELDILFASLQSRAFQGDL